MDGGSNSEESQRKAVVPKPDIIYPRPCDSLSVVTVGSTIRVPRRLISPAGADDGSMGGSYKPSLDANGMGQNYYYLVFCGILDKAANFGTFLCYVNVNKSITDVGNPDISNAACIEPISSVDVEMLEHKNLLTFIACGSYSFLAQSRWQSQFDLGLGEIEDMKRMYRQESHLFSSRRKFRGCEVVKNVTHTQTPAFHGFDPFRILVLTPASRLTRFFPSIVADPPAIIEGTLVKKKFQHISAKVAWR
ncbi:hypothetical protein B0H13DRAFT_1909825 [Mycena leptocephala]|nr:hypothetical protein B0H13DRAFT_1909825 [Mycena leptocephala]